MVYLLRQTFVALDFAPDALTPVRNPKLVLDDTWLHPRRSDNNSVPPTSRLVRSNPRDTRYLGVMRILMSLLIRIYQCINILSDIETCGGCPGALTYDGTPLAVDCTSLPYVDMVSCEDGECLIGTRLFVASPLGETLISRLGLSRRVLHRRFHSPAGEQHMCRQRLMFWRHTKVWGEVLLLGSSR